MKDLEKTVQSICTAVQGLGNDIVHRAAEREKHNDRLLSLLDDSIAKLRKSSDNLHNAIVRL